VGFRFRRAPIQLGDVLTLALGSLLPPVEHRGEDRFQPNSREGPGRRKLSRRPYSIPAGA
jgi:hypothetical protein